jgi:hypothetical protein
VEHGDEQRCWRYVSFLLCSFPIYHEAVEGVSRLGIHAPPAHLAPRSSWCDSHTQLGCTDPLPSYRPHSPAHLAYTLERHPSHPSRRELIHTNPRLSCCLLANPFLFCSLHLPGTDTTHHTPTHNINTDTRRSADASGSIPQFITNASLPGAIAEDVPSFLQWLEKRHGLSSGSIGTALPGKGERA